MVKPAYAHMVADVVKGRGAGMTEARVRNEWQAHVYGADDALALGMIDRIGTLDDTLARILSTSSDAADQRAALELPTSIAATPSEPAPTARLDGHADLALLHGIRAVILQLDT